MNQTTILPAAPPPFSGTTTSGTTTSGTTSSGTTSSGTTSSGRTTAGRSPRIARPANASAAPTPAELLAAETLQSRFALRVASRLSEGSESLDPQITARLRFSREQALERALARRRSELSTAAGATSGGAAILGRAGFQRRGGGWWFKLASVAPVFALIGGLVLIQRWQENTQVSVAAEIDAALLADDLPPTAYSDAGFVEYLKNPGQ